MGNLFVLLLYAQLTYDQRNTIVYMGLQGAMVN
jgi:hypothetical protein